MYIFPQCSESTCCGAWVRLHFFPPYFGSRSCSDYCCGSISSPLLPLKNWENNNMKTKKYYNCNTIRKYFSAVVEISLYRSWTGIFPTDYSTVKYEYIKYLFKKLFQLRSDGAPALASQNNFGSICSGFAALLYA